MSVWNKLRRIMGIGRVSTLNIPSFPSSDIGEGCGLRITSEALIALERRLNKAFRFTFMDHVRARVLAANPKLNNDAYDWALLELRRFFLMTAICKDQVPMYCENADKIWHEMLLFTREYRTFCDTFVGRFIHHQPHIAKPTGTAKIFMRVKFELIYGILFRRYPVNEQQLGAFGKNRFSEEQIEQLRQKDKEMLREDWFLQDEEASSDVAKWLVDAIQIGVELARKENQQWRDLRHGDEYASWLIAMSLSHALVQKKAADDSSSYYIGGDGKHHKHNSHTGEKKDHGSDDVGTETSCGGDSSSCSSCGGCSS